MNEHVRASLGVVMDAETIRRLTPAPGALVEQDQTERAQWAVPEAASPTCLLIEFDGVHTPLRDGDHETKAGRVAALGPGRQAGPQTGRSALVWGPSCVPLGRLHTMPRPTPTAASAPPTDLSLPAPLPRPLPTPPPATPPLASARPDGAHRYKREAHPPD